MDKTKKRVIRTGGSLSWFEREKMIKEYLNGGYSKVGIWQKYTGQEAEHGQMLKWMRILGYTSVDKSFKKAKKPAILCFDNDHLLDTTDPKELQKRIKELERQLEDAQLRAKGYEIMIDIAEKQLKIPIRKKSDTK